MQQCWFCGRTVEQSVNDFTASVRNDIEPPLELDPMTDLLVPTPSVCNVTIKCNLYREHKKVPKKNLFGTVMVCPTCAGVLKEIVKRS